MRDTHHVLLTLDESSYDPGHFGASYTENGGRNELVRQLVGGVRWVAGEGQRSDCAT